MAASLTKTSHSEEQSHKQTIAYNHFWETTRAVSKVYKSRDAIDEAEDRAKSLLDINPEGELLQEIKDVLDELHIMTNIKRIQHRVFKQFKKHVEYRIAPPLSLAKEIGTARQKKITGDPEFNGEASEEVGNIGKIKERQGDSDSDKVERDAKWTLEFAADLTVDLDDRITDLNNLKESAELTEKAVSCYTPIEMDYRADESNCS